MVVLLSQGVASSNAFTHISEKWNRTGPQSHD
jgi:hypothetical protein